MRFSFRRCFLIAVLTTLLMGVLAGIYLSRSDEDSIFAPDHHQSVKQHSKSDESLLLKKLKSPDDIWDSNQKTDDKPDRVIQQSRRGDMAGKTVDHEALRSLLKKYPISESELPNYDVHAFYYTWYGNPNFDDSYYHWNHQFLPHWNEKEREKWQTGRHKPPDDIGANFYPELGTYSSRDPNIIAQHMNQLRKAGIGVISLSWYPPGQADGEGMPTDDIVPMLLNIAHQYDMKVNFHIEPYSGRNPRDFRRKVKYILEQYGHHPAFYRHRHEGRLMPVFYVYDSYLTRSNEWSTILTSQGSETVRGTGLDALYIGLLVEEKHKNDIVDAGFDGFYTYFASNRFTYGSSWTIWPRLAAFARTKGLLFIPSVGPGYVDTEVRPWNGANSRRRDNGRYYETSFRTAMKTKPAFITITSFNEWHEGSQIEPAMVKSVKGRSYLDYRPGSSDLYLELTRKFGREYKRQKIG